MRATVIILLLIHRMALETKTGQSNFFLVEAK